jgi:hypothetical protein
MTANILCRCGRPVGDAFICTHCTATLATRLRDVPLLVESLNDSLARLTKRGPWIGDFTTSGGGSQPLPDLRAGELADAMHMRFQVTVRELTEHRGLTYTGVDSTIALALWLARHAVTIALSDHAAVTYKDLMQVMDAGWKHVDRKPDMIFLGPCSTNDCYADVYAKMGATHGVCEACESSHDVAYRRRWLWSQTNDALATLDEISQASLGLYGTRITAKRFRVWQARGKIVSHPSADGRERYRLGDVTALMAAAEDHARETARRGKEKVA